MSKIFRPHSDVNTIIKKSVGDNLRDSVFDPDKGFWITNNKVEYLRAEPWKGNVKKKEGYLRFKINQITKKVYHMDSPVDVFLPQKIPLPRSA